MKQAENDVSSRVNNPLVTGEQRFGGFDSAPEGQLCAFRAGIPILDALNHADLLMGTAHNALEALGEKSNTGPIWCISYTLENAMAAVEAAIRGLNDTTTKQ